MSERVLSFGGLDPNIVLERDGRLFRRIALSNDGRWNGLNGFVNSPAFLRLMDEGWVVRHKLDFPILSAVDYEICRVRHWNIFPWWTRKQYASAFGLVARINAFLEPSGWLASDCHPGNLVFLHANPIYADTGSFSRNTQAMAASHFETALDRIGLTPAPTWQESISVLDAYQPIYSATEWDHYAQPPQPDSVSDIRPTHPEQELLLDWASAFPDGDVLELGANRGHLSRLLAVAGHEVVSTDISEACVDDAWQTARKLGLPITSCCLDLTATVSIQSLACDVVIASSITHHLYRQGMNWVQQEALFRGLTRRQLLVEQILPDDPYIQSWNLPAEYGEFEAAFSGWRVIAESQPELPSRRWLRMEPA